MDYPSQPKYALRCLAAEDRAVLGHPLSKLPPTGAATSDSEADFLTVAAVCGHVGENGSKVSFSVCGVGRGVAGRPEDG